MKKFLILIIIGAACVGGYFLYKGWSESGNQPTSTTASSSPSSSQDNESIKNDASPEAIAGISGYTYTEPYASGTYGFTFKYPKSFEINEFSGDNNAYIILVQNLEQKVGLQVVITPIADSGIPADLTPDNMKTLTDMSMNDARTVEADGHTGVSFEGNNPSFEGDSREIWFVHGKNLYQISTYEKFAAFAGNLFATWKFNQ